MSGIPWGNGGRMADVRAGTHSGTPIMVGERAGAREDDSKVMMEGVE